MFMANNTSPTETKGNCWWLVHGERKEKVLPKGGILSGEQKSVFRRTLNDTA